MSGEFLGTYTNSVNKNKWIIIPSPFKKKFSEEANKTVIVTIGPEENIGIFPLDNWNEKIEKLKSGTDRDTDLLVNLRTFASSEQTIEKSGRIKISNELLEIAGITEKVIIKGEGNYISVWNPEKYVDFRNEKLKVHKKSFNTQDYQK
ncbi:MAG TPA: protein MraZ [Candidatus Cloacimonetes bacterium]|nr:protein MraZ [Candidatus Cloacimonadota bacterium]